MNRRIFAAILAATFLMPIGTAFAQSSASSHKVSVTLVKPVKTVPLRTMKNLQLPAIMRNIVGNHNLSQQYFDGLHNKLVKSGVLPAPGTHRVIPLMRMKPAMQQAPGVRDSVLQTALPQAKANALAPRAFTTPIVSFDGMGTSSGDSVGCAPPDTNAATGQNYVVEIVNLCNTGAGEFEVYDKAGNSVLGPIPLAALWSGGNCVFGQAGDNVVLYDQLAQRWVLSQFATSGAFPTDECVAVSATSDPTGAYYVYDFSIDPAGFTDYPKMGVWPDAYYTAFNDFSNPGPSYDHVNFVAFNRKEMLQGLPAQQVIINGTSVYQGGLDYSVLPADLDGYSPPPAGSPGIFVNYSSPILFGSGFPYALNMWQMHVDWVNPSNSTLTGPTSISVSPFIDGVVTNAPEPGGNSVDTLGDRLMFRLAYRNFSGSHQALVVNQTVTASGTAAPPLGVRWYELDAPSGATSATAWSVKQQSTFAPADGTSRWMGSVAMDHSGNMALGYSYSSPNVNPGIAYTGRLAGDALNKMTQPETVLQAGGGYETGTNRWGDYSSMALDPSDDCTFWYAQEYYAATGSYGWSTHIGAFKFAGCTPVALGTLTGTVTDASTGNPVAGAYVSTANGFSAVTDASGKYSITLAAGTYTETAKAYPYTESSGTQVSITGGQTTTQNIVLQLAPKVTLSGDVTDGSGHGWGLYANVVVTTPSAGTSITASSYTDPATGKYSVQVPKGFAYTVKATASATAYNSGYESATKSLVVNQAATQDMALNVTADCVTPGYNIAYGQTFNGSAFPPSGWSVTNNVSGSIVVWNVNTYWGDNNLTGGSGFSADANSDAAGPGPGSYDTSLISPPISVASLNGAHMLHFLTNFIVFSSEALDVDISVDGGTTWTTMKHITSSVGSLYNLPGGSETVDLSSYLPSGTTQFQLRWRYYNLVSDWDWYAQVDDVQIGQCSALPGGLVVGQLTDANTGAAVPGALITDDLAATTTPFLTPNDPNLKDLYVLFGPAGSRTLVASQSSSSFVSSTADVKADQAVRDDMAFGNADLEITSLKGTDVEQSQFGNVATITVTNNGPDTAAGVTLTTSVSPLLQVEPGSTTTQGTCQADFRNRGVNCAIGDIAPGDSVTVTMRAYGVIAGQATITAHASEIDNDPNQQNNSATTNTQVTAPAPNSNGGGGSLGWLALAALLGLALSAGVVSRAKRVR